MRVFSITPDVNRYMSVGASEEVAATQMQVMGDRWMAIGPKADIWTPCEINWLVDAGTVVREAPDIASFAPGEFAVRASVADLLRPTLERVMEFLPVHFDGSPWFVLNTINIEDVMDADKTERKVLANGRPSPIFKRIALTPSLIQNGATFRVKGLGSRLYGTDTEGGLWDLVTRHGLTGLVFTPID